MERRLHTRDYMMFMEAWSLLAIARLMLLFVPFRKIVPVLQSKNVKDVPQEQKMEILQGIQVAIARACIRSPWRAKCFEQALAAKMMTRSRGLESVTYFGVKKEGEMDKLQAHAWLKSGEFVVTGWQRMNTYSVVARF